MLLKFKLLFYENMFICKLEVIAAELISSPSFKKVKKHLGMYPLYSAQLALSRPRGRVTQRLILCWS